MTFTSEDFDYIRSVRRHLHQYPELCFDLPKTVAIVENELKSMGLEYTTKYCRSSLVVDLGGHLGGPSIAVRADMDGLPVEEKTNLEFQSKHPGKMHACGHDCNVATALGVARILSKNQKNLPFRVRFVFQPAEECDVSGAKEMVDNGVLEGIDYVMAQHIAPDIDVGFVGASPVAAASACCPMDITFRGLSAHATKPHASRDALAMGVTAYVNMQTVLQRQVPPGKTYVCSVGSLQAGDVHNVIPATANLQVSVRAHTLTLLGDLVDKIKACCEGSASLFGGSVDIKADVSAYATINDERLSDLFYESAAQVLGDEKVLKLEPRLSSDDFSWFTDARPGLYYWVGTRNLAKWPEKALHNNDFMVDEDSLAIGAKVMLNYFQSLVQFHHEISLTE